MLKQKAKIAVLWSSADTILRQGLQFGISIALARLLSPEEFGTIALLYLFTGIASVFIDSGFSSALIQKKDTSKIDESTVFWINLTIGILASISLWHAAPAISKFYGIDILIPIINVMSLSIFIGALGSIHTTLLAKNLDFKTLMKVGAVSTTLSGITAVFLALNNFGIWALVGQILVATSTTTIMLWILNKWRPSLEFSLDSMRCLFGFGGYMLASSLLNIVNGRAYSLLIGKLHGATELGLYNRAESTIGLPAGILSSILSRVAFPIFSEASKDNEKLFRGARRAIQGIMFINIPIMLGLAVTAESTVQTLFGSRWLPAVPVMQILCIGGIFWPLHVINLDILKAQGYSNLFFRLEIIKITIGISALVGGSFFGVLGIAWGQVMSSVICFFINAQHTKKYLNYGALKQLRDILPTLAISLTMAASVRTLYLNSQLSSNFELITLIISGFIIFILLAFIFKLHSMHQLLNFFKRPAND